MKIYFACTGPREPIYLLEAGMTDLLLSYHYYQKKGDFVAELRKGGIDVFMDSGAFSASTLGKEIDLDAYVKFVHDNNVTNYVVLDVIESAEKTLENQREMEKQGAKPFPCFHAGEERKFLLQYLEEYDKLALGGMVPLSTERIIHWLDEVWHIILQVKPTMNVHGFGVTSPEIMLRYPWTSCDSSSFKSGKRFGRMIEYLPHKMKFYTSDFSVWVEEYAVRKNCPEIREDSALRYQITDVASARSFMEFAKHKRERNMSYAHLTDQLKLF